MPGGNSQWQVVPPAMQPSPRASGEREGTHRDSDGEGEVSVRRTTDSALAPTSPARFARTHSLRKRAARVYLSRFRAERANWLDPFDDSPPSHETVAIARAKKGGSPMADLDLCYLPASEMAKRIRDGRLSPVDLVDNALARIEEANPSLNCFCFTYPEEARAKAKAAHEAVKAGKKLGHL